MLRTLFGSRHIVMCVIMEVDTEPIVVGMPVVRIAMKLYEEKQQASGDKRLVRHDAECCERLPVSPDTE
jgi:hypothetical protein